MTVATYTKLKSGDWGVRVPVGAPAIVAGMKVQVQKRDGSSKDEIIERIVWSGAGVTVCSIKSAAQAGQGRKMFSGRRLSGTGRGDGGPRGSRPCYMCGSFYCEGARGGLCQDD